MKEKENKSNKFKTKKILFTVGVAATTTIGVGIPLAVIAQNKTFNNTTAEEQYRNNLEGPVSLQSVSHDSPELSNSKRKAVYILNKFIYFSVMFDEPSQGKSKTRDIVLLNAKNAIRHASNIEEVRSLTTKAKKDWILAFTADNLANHLKAAKIQAIVTLDNFIKELPNLPIDEVSKQDIKQRTAFTKELIEKAKSIGVVNNKLHVAMIIIKDIHESAVNFYIKKQDEIKNADLHSLIKEQKWINKFVANTSTDSHRFSHGAPLSGKLDTRFAKQEFGIDINRSTTGREYLISYLRYHGQVVKDDDSWQKLTIPSFSLYIDKMEFFFPVGSYFYVNNHGHDKQVMMSKAVGKKSGPSCIYFDHLYDRLNLKGVHHFTYTYEVTDRGIKITAHSFDRPDLTSGIEPTEILLGSSWEDDVFKVKELYKKQKAINNVVSSKSSVTIPDVSNLNYNKPLSRDVAAKLGISDIFKRVFRKDTFIGQGGQAKEEITSSSVSKYKPALHYYQLLSQLNLSGNKFVKTYKKQFFNANTWFSYDSHNLVMLKNNKNCYLELLGDTRIKLSFLLNGKPTSFVWTASSRLSLHSFRFLIDKNISPVDSVKKLKESFIAQGQPVIEGHDKQKLITDVITYDFIDGHVVRQVHKTGSYFQFGDASSENSVFIGNEVNSVNDMLSHKYAKYFTGDIALGVPKFVYTYNLTNNGNVVVKVHRFDKKNISPAKAKEIILPISFKKEKNLALITLEKLIAQIKLYSLLRSPEKMIDEILTAHKYSILNSNSISKINQELTSGIQHIKLLMNKSTREMLDIHQMRINHLISTKNIKLPKAMLTSQDIDAKTAKEKFGIDLEANNMNSLEQGAMRNFIIERLKFLGQKVKNDDSWQTLTVNASIYFESIKKVIHFPIGTKFYVNNHGSDRLVGFGNSNFKLRLANGQSTITTTNHLMISVHSVHFRYTYKVDLSGKGIIITVHLIDQPEIKSFIKPTSIIIV